MQERVYVPLEDELHAHDVEGRPVRQNRAVGGTLGSAAGVAPAHEEESPSAGPTMEQIFGPGGFLERSMIGGYEHRPAQLQMAEAVHDAFQKHHHKIGRAHV